MAARNTDYVRAALDGWEASGGCSAIGHDARARLRRRGVRQRHRGARRGLRRHLRGRPDPCRRGHRAGGSRNRRTRAPLGLGRAGGHCDGCRADHRASLVTPKMIHKAGFHPTAVLGAMGAAAGVATALGLPSSSSMRSASWARCRGIIEYLAEEPGPSACIPAGRRSPGSAPPTSRARASSARAPCSKANTACITASRARRAASGTSCSTASANAG